MVGWAKLIAVAPLVFAVPAEPLGQTTVRTPAELIIPSMSGVDLFRFYCASCHGPDGRGHGPAAVALRTTPPDLSTLSLRHGGSFPRQDVDLYFTGDELRPTAAHGSKEMPVWGRSFARWIPTIGPARFESGTFWTTWNPSRRSDRRYGYGHDRTSGALS